MRSGRRPLSKASVAPMSNYKNLSICLFGAHLFRSNGKPCGLGLRGATLELLRYLVVHAGREVRREAVADQLWGGSAPIRQRSALNSALWRIGKKLPKHPGLVLHARSASVCLEIDETIPFDIRDLSKLVQTAGEPEAVDQALAERLAAALTATEAPFMNGIVEDWALAEQERVFNIRMRGLTLLMRWYGDARRYEDALEVGRRQLLEDPFREAVQIDMMWLYVLNGQRAQALRQYQRYADLLMRELDIAPMSETTALYDYIRCDMNQDPAMAPAADRATDGHDIRRRELDATLMLIEQSRRELYQALRTQLA